MPFLLQHTASGQYLCAEAPFIQQKRGEAEVQMGGDWSTVDHTKDATRFSTKARAGEEAKKHSLTSAPWQVIPA